MFVSVLIWYLIVLWLCDRWTYTLIAIYFGVYFDLHVVDMLCFRNEMVMMNAFFFF